MPRREFDRLVAREDGLDYVGCKKGQSKHTADLTIFNFRLASERGHRDFPSPDQTAHPIMSFGYRFDELCIDPGWLFLSSDDQPGFDAVAYTGEMVV